MKKSFFILFPLIVFFTLYVPGASAQTSCPAKGRGDADCNGRVNRDDYLIWKDELAYRPDRPRSDFNGDNRIDMVDYEIWRRNLGYFSGASADPSIPPVPSGFPSQTENPSPVAPGTGIGPTAVPSAIPTVTLPIITDTPTPTPLPDETVTEIEAGDTANEDGDSVQTDSNIVWIGNGSSVNKSYTAFRFPDVRVPRGSRIISAHLLLRNRQEQHIFLKFNLSAEDTDNSLPFSERNPPSGRKLISEVISHLSDLKWNARARITLNDMKRTVQRIVDKPGWQSGNAISVIIRGTGGSWGRKFVSGISADKTLIPKLVIRYKNPS